MAPKPLSLKALKLKEDLLSYLSGEASQTVENSLKAFGLLEDAPDGGLIVITERQIELEQTNDQTIISSNHWTKREKVNSGSMPKGKGPELVVASSSSVGAVDISWLGVEEALKNLERAGLHVSSEEVFGSIEAFLDEIPQQDSYLPGEVVIYVMEPTKDMIEKSIADKKPKYSFANILGSGTKALDAILFHAFHDSNEKNLMFTINYINKGDYARMCRKIAEARQVFCAGSVNYWVRGNLPQKIQGDNPRELMDFIKKNTGEGAYQFEYEIAELLSSAPINKFPAEAIYKMGIAKLPREFFGRIKLSVAGQKAFRYCSLALRFDQAVEPANLRDAAEFARWGKIRHAQALVKFCAENSQFEQTSKLHPGNSSNLRPQKLTYRLTNAVLHSLTEKGRMDMRNHIREKKIGSFMKDQNLMGIGAADDNDIIIWSIMDEPDADFASLSVEGIRAFVK